jgi:uncharacterized protein (DUF2267 family)
MTQQQFLEEIKQLSLAERIALIEAIFRSLREELETSDRNAAIFGAEHPEAIIQNESERRLAAVRRLQGALKQTKDQGSGEGNVPISQRLYGILKFEGEAPGDEELKDAYADYLLEKYS